MHAIHVLNQEGQLVTCFEALITENAVPYPVTVAFGDDGNLWVGSNTKLVIGLTFMKRIKRI